MEVATSPPPDHDSSQPEPSDLLVLYLTGETRGNLTPCACPDAPWGGLDRRVGFLRAAVQRNPDALILDSGGFLPVGETALRDDPEAGSRLVSLLLNSFWAGGVALTAVEPGVMSFLHQTVPVEAQHLEGRFLVTHPPGRVQVLDWNGRPTAVYAVNNDWTDSEIVAIAERARAEAATTIVLARANAIEGRRVARLTQADLVALSRGGRPETPLPEGRSIMIGAGKLGREVVEIVFAPDESGLTVVHYEHHPMSDQAPSDSGFRNAIETLLAEFGAGWDLVTAALD